MILMNQNIQVSEMHFPFPMLIYIPEKLFQERLSEENAWMGQQKNVW